MIEKKGSQEVLFEDMKEDITEKAEELKVEIVNEIVPIDEKQIEEIRPQTISLFGSIPPAEAIEKAKEVALVVADIIKQRKLWVSIKGKVHVFCEGWTTMGALLGIFARITEVEDLSEPEISLIRKKAKCEARDLNNRLYSSAYAECDNEEANWKSDKNQAISSMAQTRAIGKCLKIPLGWIMQLAGYEPTPAEEMTLEVVDKITAVKNGADEVDVFETELANKCPKAEGMTIKEHKKREITYLCSLLFIDEKGFKKKVYDGDFEKADIGKLAEIRNMLMNVHFRSMPYVKIN